MDRVAVVMIGVSDVELFIATARSFVRVTMMVFVTMMRIVAMSTVGPMVQVTMVEVQPA